MVDWGRGDLRGMRQTLRDVGKREDKDRILNKEEKEHKMRMEAEALAEEIEEELGEGVEEGNVDVEEVIIEEEKK